MTFAPPSFSSLNGKLLNFEGYVGRGSQGSVYRYRDKDDVHYAVKFSPLGNEDEARAYLREVLLLYTVCDDGALAIEHIVCPESMALVRNANPVFWGSHTSRLGAFDMLDYVTRYDAAQTVTRDDRNRRAARLVRALIDNTRYMHDRGFAHLDVKPRNIIVELEDDSNVLSRLVRTRFIDFNLGCARHQAAIRTPRLYRKRVKPLLEASLPQALGLDLGTVLAPRKRTRDDDRMPRELPSPLDVLMNERDMDIIDIVMCESVDEQLDALQSIEYQYYPDPLLLDAQTRNLKRSGRSFAMSTFRDVYSIAIIYMQLTLPPALADDLLDNVLRGGSDRLPSTSDLSVFVERHFTDEPGGRLTRSTLNIMLGFLGSGSSTSDGVLDMVDEELIPIS